MNIEIVNTNLKSHLKLLRIQNWRGYFLIASLGFFLSRGFLFPVKDVTFFYLIILLFLSFGFSINDCFDTEEDKLDKDKENIIVLKKISFKRGLVFSILLAVLGLILSTKFGLRVFLFCLAEILLILFYSSPPLRLKSRPLLDLISHGLFAGALVFLIPVLIFSKDLLFHYLIAFSIFYFSITLELRNHLEDYETDREADLKTTVCFLGYEKSEKLLRRLGILYPFTLAPIFLLISWQYFLVFLALTLTFLFLVLFKKDYRIVSSYRVMDAYAHICFIFLIYYYLRI